MRWTTLRRVALTGVVLSSVARWVQPGAMFGAPDAPDGRRAADEVAAIADARTAVTVPGPGRGDLLVGTFTEWSVYEPGYHVRHIDESGAAAQLTHIVYAWGSVQGGECRLEDSHAAFERFYGAGESVDGVADPEPSAGDDILRGSFNQLRELKQAHPQLRLLWSFGGWFGSAGYAEAAEDPEAFAESCHELVEDPLWADVFDGIVIDWQLPNACAEVCDASGFAAFPELIEAVRARFGPDDLVTATITGDASEGGALDAADYAGAAPFVDWFMVATYDYFGPWEPGVPTAPSSPLTSYDGIPDPGLSADAAIRSLLGRGVPAGKLLLGVGFFGEGWTGVTQPTPGGDATEAAPGTFRQGGDEYRVLSTTCPPTATIAGTAYAVCGDEWWSYDTPATLAGKMRYVQDHDLAGAHFWELRADTPTADLVTALHDALD
jgi:chitinase